MKLHHRYGIAALLPALLILTAAVHPRPDDAEVGAPAPAFSLIDTEGNTHSLESLRGRYVVLEWLNFGCPYVQRHYNSGNMPALQEEYTGKDVVWLSIVSSALGEQGYYEPAEMNKQRDNFGGLQSAILLDPEGDVGRMYGAMTTPHMYIIDPAGTLIYKGGIDDKPRAKESETQSANNYVRAALNEAMNGKEVSVKTSRPYGCSVKYKG